MLLESNIAQMPPYLTIQPLGMWLPKTNNALHSYRIEDIIPYFES